MLEGCSAAGSPCPRARVDATRVYELFKRLNSLPRARVDATHQKHSSTVSSGAILTLDNMAGRAGSTPKPPFSAATGRFLALDKDPLSRHSAR